MAARAPPLVYDGIKRSLSHITLACLLGLTVSACQTGPHDAHQYPVAGLDVSHYQGLIDWEEVDREEFDFVFIKATEGRTLRDDAFLHNWTEAGKIGLRRGAYHFFRPGVPIGQQARLFTSTVDLRPGDLPPVLDVETAGSFTGQQLAGEIREWVSLMELRYGVTPIIYTGQNFYNRHLAGQIADLPLWLARYDREQPVTVCGRPYQFWQYTDRGHSQGVEGRVDVNVFTGTRRELAALCVPAPEQPTYPEPLRDNPISAQPTPGPVPADLVNVAPAG